MNNTVMRIIMVIFGMFLISGGVHCMFAPGATILAFAPVCGTVIIVDAIAGICSYVSGRKNGEKDGWSLFGSILSLVIGIALIVNIYASIFADVLMLSFVAIWLVVVGVVRVIAAFNVRKIGKEIGIFTGWGFMLVMGVLMVVAGIASIANPYVLAISVGTMIGASIMVAGVSTVSLAFCIR